ncbi:MAG: hypothetical protein IKE91_07115 [Clostridia bacterium]|nr:hypothetical protein [Clostridia bacterium]
MIVDFCNRLINSYNDVCKAVEDITMAINGDPKSTSEYRLIPGDKSRNNNFVVNAVDFSTLNETTIFIGKHTVGVKMFGPKHTPICNYAITRKDGVQIVQIKYPDGTGMEQKCVFDKYANAYLFNRTNVTLPAEELFDLDVYGNAIIQQGFPIAIVYQQTNTLNIGVSFPNNGIDVNPILNDNAIRTAELRRISEYVGGNAMSFIHAHTNCLSLVSPKEIYTNALEFQKAFTRMIRQLKKEQGSINPMEPDTPVQNDR